MASYLYQGGEGKIKAAFEYGISLLRTASVIKKGKYDVVHIQTFKNAKLEMGIYRRYRKDLGNLFILCTMLCLMRLRAEDLRLYGAFYDFCDELIVHNETSAKYLEQNFRISAAKITVIPTELIKHI